MSFTSIDRLNAILAIAPTENYIKRTKTWVQRLDKTINADQRRLFVYFVNNGLADDLVKTLQGVFAVNLTAQLLLKEAVVKIQKPPQAMKIL